MAERWVSVTEAARLEEAAGRSVNKSSISRFLDRNPDVPVKRDERGRVMQVEYEALVAARGASLSVSDAREGMLPLTAPAAPSPGAAAPAAGSRKRALEEEKLELDLAERKREVLDRAAVQLAVETAAVAFTQSLERRRRTLANKLEGLGAREMELAMKAADRDLLRTLSQDLARSAAGLTAPDGEPSLEAAGDGAEAA